MSDAKKILAQKGEEAARAGRLFLDAVCGDSRAVGKKIAAEAARERGHRELAAVLDANELASVIDAEIVEDDE